MRHNRDLLLLHYPTNGYLTDRIVEQTREIARLRPPKLIITVSCDGDEALNDEIRGVPGGYRRQLETFRRLREIKGIDVVLGMTLSKRNCDRREETFEAIRRDVPGFEYRDLHVNVVHESSHYLSNAEDEHCQFDDAVRQRLINETKLHAARRARVTWHPVDYLERAYLSRVERFLRSGGTPMRCHALRGSCFIDSWGTVFPCTIYDRPLGSLRQCGYDLATIWNAAETGAVQQEIWQNRCPQCWTPCEAYVAIMGNFLRWGDPGPPPPASARAALPSITAPPPPPPEPALVQIESTGAAK